MVTAGRASESKYWELAGRKGYGLCGQGAERVCGMEVSKLHCQKNLWGAG